MSNSNVQEAVDSRRQAEAVDPRDAELDQVDRLSALPDDVLMLILDKLVMLRDAVRTSILSKRWRNLTGLHSEIVLDVIDYEPEGDDSKYTLADLVRTNTFVVEATKSILAHKSQHAIRYLSIRFYLRDESIDIVRSVDKAMANREVERAAFKILPEMVFKYCTDDDMLAYGRRFMMFFDAYPRAFAGLTDLRIHSLRLGESDIPNVLNTCKKLDFLSLTCCDAGFRSALHIEHPELKELSIFSCGFEKIELKWLPKLTHLSFRTWLPSQDQYPLSFGYVPQLWMLYLSNEGTTLHKTIKLSEFLSNVTIIELEMNFLSERIWIQPEGSILLASPLQNLQMVKLHYVHEECGLIWTMFFLEAAPLLRELSIQVWNHKCYSSEEDEYKEHDALWQEIFQKSTDHLNWEPHNDFKHYNLSKITIEGFQVEEKFTRFIRLVMGVAVNLELVSLLESNPCLGCQFRPSSTYPRTKEERDLIVKQISGWRSIPIKIEIGV